MSILCTFPGKLGDILWALPTVRTISETYGERVDFRCCQSPKDFSSILPLLRRQSYLASAEVLPDWQPREEGPYPFTPRAPETIEGEYDRIFHLGYEGWPSPDLARDTWTRAVAQADRPLAFADHSRPWITAPYALPAKDVVIGFTDEHFELKYGLFMLLFRRWSMVNLSTSPRWTSEGQQSGYDWSSAAAWLAGAQVFLGCCSALHVLACAMGVPVVLMEPNSQRWHDVFYPYGKAGERVQLVLGGDGQPTFDARHVADAVDRVLIRRKEEGTHAGQVQ